MAEGLRVIGAGMHRTGSMSVKAALERLGFGPCYHGLEALRRSTDGEHWLRAYKAGGAADWQVIFEGYQATLDWPTIHFWEQLATAYPDAKIDEPFDLGYNLDQIELRPTGVRVTLKR